MSCPINVSLPSPCVSVAALTVALVHAVSTLGGGCAVAGAISTIEGGASSPCNAVVCACVCRGSRGSGFIATSSSGRTFIIPWTDLFTH